MPYYLGIDLGTTYTAAAVLRDDVVRPVTLGNRTSMVPSVVYLTDDSILVGDAANRRAIREPNRVAREFKRRMGDPTPIMLGGSPYPAEMLMGKLLRWVVDRAAEMEGGPPTGIGLTHPANWGPFKLDLFSQGVRQAGVDEICPIVKLTEPAAAAMAYAANERVDEGELLAVYDLGGGTFDAVVLRKATGQFALLGEPEGIERLGGIDFDQAVFNHVVESAGIDLDDLDDDEATLSAMARLRQECAEAKELLSSDTDVSIPVMLPKLRTEVRLTRNEFEQLIRNPLRETCATLGRAVRSAGVRVEDLSRILLVGGSSRIPLVAQLVVQEYERPVAVDANPKDTISFGAALAASAAGAGVRTIDPQRVESQQSFQHVAPAPLPGQVPPGQAPPHGQVPPGQAPPHGSAPGPVAPGPYPTPVPGPAQPGPRPGQAPPPALPPPGGPVPAGPHGPPPGRAPQGPPPQYPGPGGPPQPVYPSGPPGPGGQQARPGGPPQPQYPQQPAAYQGPPPQRGPQPGPAQPGGYRPPPGGPPGVHQPGRAAGPGGPAQPPGQRPSGQPAAGRPGQPVQKSRTPLLAGVIAAVVVVAVLAAVLLTRGGGDDPEDASSQSESSSSTDAPDETNETGTTETTESTEAPDDGYTEAVESNFIDACLAAPDSNLSVDQLQDFCQCGWDGIVEQIPFADYVEFEENLETDDDLPTEIQAIVDACNESIATG